MTSLPENRWSVGRGTLRGKTVHFSINRALDAVLAAGSLPFEVRFSTEILRSSEAGLPATHEEEEFLRAFEDALVPAIEALGDSPFAVRVTSDGIRDFVFYTAKPDPLVAYFEEKIKPSATRLIELHIAERSSRIYRLFAAAEEPNSERSAAP